MSKRRKTLFEESLILNNLSFKQYYDILHELSMCMFKWENVPETIDVRYIELQLFECGAVVYFNDNIIGDLCLNCLTTGNLDVYGNPITVTAYSCYNNYRKDLNNKNSVIIWNNYLHTNSKMYVEMFARRLYNIDRIIDVNTNAQKTPVLLQGTEKQKLTLINLYKEWDGNAPFIFGDNNLDNFFTTFYTELSSE